MEFDQVLVRMIIHHTAVLKEFRGPQRGKLFLACLLPVFGCGHLDVIGKFAHQRPLSRPISDVEHAVLIEVEAFHRVLVEEAVKDSGNCGWRT